MKRIISVFLCMAMLLSFVACGNNQANNSENELSDTTSETSNGGSGTKGSTLMIYMVGSDLEAKGGAGTNDLKEITESGIDLEQNNVVIYVGGSPKWHNDSFVGEKQNNVLVLGNEGFTSVSQTPTTSMGESECLANFLNYSVENYPAENYSLILWNHGNGPIIGYGKDMLHDNDSLTLSEMRQALNNSPFGADKKLDFVGFDACLMSSAELVCVWDDYAEYLVASQEIEPAFGWNYSFLSQYGKIPAKELISTITQKYLEACEAYYERKGFDDRDTTLACMDLSHSDILESCINALFKSATPDVSESYSELAAARVETRALGRASTGSEYDLIDLYDLAVQMSNSYPDETQALMDVIKTMVVSNATNTQNLCGMSIYYPFYNKSHYEKSWGETYAEIGVLADYASYLESYTQKWLQKDFLENLASSTTPSDAGEGKYTLQLTDDQSKTYSDSTYYILRREGDGLYTIIYRSSNIAHNQNVLTANFDGQIIYGKNKFDQYFIPAVIEHDTIGDTTRYGIAVGVTNEPSLIFSPPEGYIQERDSLRFHINANNKTKTITTSALVPYDEKVSANSLIGGKIEDADLTGWTTYRFPHDRHRYIEYYENGAIKPISMWTLSDYYSQSVLKIGDDVDFMFAPIAGGEYYLIFEIQDTQGSKYCSDLLPIELEGGEFEVNYKRDPIEMTWDIGEELKVLEEEGVSIYFTTIENNGHIDYTLKVNNDNDFAVSIKGSDLYFNGNIFCADGSYGYFTVPAGETYVDKYGFNFGNTADLDIMKELKSIQFILTVETQTGERTLIKDQPISVNLTRDTTYIPTNGFFSVKYDYDAATRGVLAPQQVVAEDNGVKVELLGFGGDGSENGRLNAVFRIENNSNVYRYVNINGFVVDGIYMDVSKGTATIPNGCVVYETFTLYENDLKHYMVNQPKEIKLDIRFPEFDTLIGGGGFNEQIWCDVKTDSVGSGSIFTEGETVIFEENGIRISLNKLTPPDDITENDSFTWELTIVNNSATDFAIDTGSIYINGVLPEEALLTGAWCSRAFVGSGQSTLLEINCYDQYGDKVELEFDFHFYDIVFEKLLWKSNSPITLIGKK